MDFAICKLFGDFSDTKPEDEEFQFIAFMYYFPTAELAVWSLGLIYEKKLNLPL